MADRYRVRSVINWLTLATPCGCALGAASGARFTSGPRGIIYATGYRLRWPKAAAFTVGNVVLLRAETIEVGPSLLAHEERHATQWACCLGMIGFPSLYLVSMLASWAATGDHASGNPFERGAGLSEGGYRRRPLRWAKAR